MTIFNKSDNNILKVVLKNASLILTDSVTMGASSKIKDTYSEIVQYTKDCNEALYYLQVERFINSIDISADEFEDFIKKNPDNLKLGLETIKILEQTTIEKQAEMLAKALKNYIKNPSVKEKETFYRNSYIIKRLDNYLLSEVDKLKEYKINPILPNARVGEKQSFNGFILNPPTELINFGFLKKPDINVIGGGIELYILTEYYSYFYNNILIK